MSVFSFLALISIGIEAIATSFFFYFRPGSEPWEVWALGLLGLIGIVSALLTSAWHERWTAARRR